jgi:hypothetical protein
VGRVGTGSRPRTGEDASESKSGFESGDKFFFDFISLTISKAYEKFAKNLWREKCGARLSAQANFPQANFPL